LGRVAAFCIFACQFFLLILQQKTLMGSLVVTPKSVEEMKFLVDLLERLGISAQLLSEEEEAGFLAEHELTEAGKVFLDKRAQAALQQKNRKTWKEVQAETAAKYNWPKN
jgi:hypothetical protein